MAEKPNTLAFVDTETSGLDAKKHEIVEIAIIKTNFEGVIVDTPFNVRCKMTRPEIAEEEALGINGYNEIDWAGTLPFSNYAIKVAQLLTNCYFAAFNATFDESFLLQYIPKRTWRVHHYEFSTHALDLFFQGKIESARQPYYSRYYGLDQGKVHSAYNDANILREIYLKRRAV